jgi:hypothetical protein
VTQTEFTAAICEALYAAPKSLASRIVWRQKDSRTFLFQAKVLAEEGIVLDLSGYWCHDAFHGCKHWGFSLRYLGHCIRSWDMAKKHKNPNSGWVRGPHKHKFDSTKAPRFAYKPNPPVSDTDPNQALLDFLLESHIEPPEDYQNVMFP